MQRLHNFMDKMREKPLEERRKLLLSSTVFSGVLIAVLGVWNISSNLVSLNQSPSALAAAEKEKANTPSLFTTLGDGVANVWSGVKANLQSLNDKLGSPQDSNTGQQQ